MKQMSNFNHLWCILVFNFILWNRHIRKPNNQWLFIIDSQTYMKSTYTKLNINLHYEFDIYENQWLFIIYSKQQAKAVVRKKSTNMKSTYLEVDCWLVSGTDDREQRLAIGERPATGSRDRWLESITRSWEWRLKSQKSEVGRGWGEWPNGIGREFGNHKYEN